MRLGFRGPLLLVIAQAGHSFVMGSAVDGTARADESPTSQPAAPKPHDTFHLSIADFYAGLQSDYEFRRVRSSPDSGWIFRPRSSTQENRDARLEETLGLSLTGDILDPNLIDYRADLEFGLTQTRFKEKSDWPSPARQTDSDSGTLLEYDISIDALKNKPISLNAYARRADVRVPRRFLPSLHELQDEAGVSALAITGPVTTEIGYSFRDIERRGNRLDEDNESITSNRFYLDSKWAIAEDHTLHLSYDHEREKNDYQGSLYHFNTSRDELRLDHELAFGEAHHNHLDTYFRYNEESGDLARDELEIVSRLTLQHTDKFKTIYRYGFDRVEQDAIDLGQHMFDAQALYQASKDLRLSLDGFGLYERFDRDVETRQYGISGDATYTKNTSAGDLSADLNLGYDQTRTTGDAGRRYVRNEAHVLGGIVPVFLRERGVLPMTVLAHDDRFTRLFLPGVDFSIIVIAGRATINRIPWGRIAEGDVVYFDYQYVLPAAATLNTYRMDFRVEFATKFGLTPYYYFENRSQEVDERPGFYPSFQWWGLGAYTPPARDNQDRHRLGLRYGQDRWSVTGEYEIFDDSIEPYDAFHITGQASLFRSTTHSLDMTSEVSRYYFEGGVDRRRVWYLDLSVKDRVDISNLLSVHTAAELRHEDDSVRGRTKGIDIEAGLQYTRGYLTVELNAEYDLLSVVENRENGFGIFLNVKRDLTHLVPAGLRAAQ